MMSSVKLSDKNVAEPMEKEWERPELRKLPIAATAGSTHTGANDGNTTKNGSSGSQS